MKVSSVAACAVVAGVTLLPFQPWSVPAGGSCSWEGMAIVFVSLLGGLSAWDWAVRSRTLRLGERVERMRAAANASPGWAIVSMAFLATLVANYPVVFAGRSFVSPYVGSALAERQNTVVPGFQGAEGGDAEGTDSSAPMVPLSMLQHRALFVDREWPLWNRYDSAGSPLLGQGRSAFGDPLQMIPVVANGAPWAWDLKFLLAKGLFACGIGFCVWRLTRHVPASLLMAASAQFIGFFAFRVGNPAIFSLCYSPWILYCWFRIVDGTSARGTVLWMTALLGVNLTEMNSGTVEEAGMLLLWMNVTGLCVLCASARAWRVKGGLLAGTAVGAVLLALIGSPVWLTVYDALRDAHGAQVIPRAFQVQPGMVLGLFDGAFYGPFQLFADAARPSANFLVLIGLLWIGVRWRSAASNRAAVALLLSSLMPLLLAFGVISPGVILRIPLLVNVLHIDATFSCVAITILAVLAGLGWKEAWERLGSSDGKRDAVAVLTLLAGLYGAYLGTAQAVVRSAYFESTWGKMIHLGGFVHMYGLSLIVAAALLQWTLHGARRRGTPTPAMALLALLAFALLNWHGGLQVGTRLADDVPVPAPRVDAKARFPTIDALLAHRGTPFRTVGFGDLWFPGGANAYGMEGISGPNALVNPYYRQVVDAAVIGWLRDGRSGAQAGQTQALRPLLDLLNVRLYLDYPAAQGPSDTGPRPSLPGDLETYESPSAWPRAFYTDGVALYDDAGQFGALVRSGDGRPFAALTSREWAAFPPLPRVTRDLPTRQVRAADHYEQTTNTTSFSVTAPRSGFIVLTEAYERGDFRATLNGESVPYVRMNHAFKGVYVDAPGTYRVTFTYRPRDFSLALGLFGVGLGLVFMGLTAAILVLKPGPGSPPVRI
jgi:hypothetical protein